MSKLKLKTQNTKGGNPQWKEDLGYTALFLDSEDNRIIADAFEGLGASYKRREQTQIIITKGNVNHVFPSFDSLWNHLERRATKYKGNTPSGKKTLTIIN